MKFSINNGLDTRWSDLLVAEYSASAVLREYGISAAHSRIVEREGFTFLAVNRFDRIGTSGRRAVHSLEAIDNGFFGNAGSNWMQMADRLLEDHLISEETCQQIRTIWSFGRAIGNTDMHLGNLSFFINKDDRFELAPVYDMLPMRYAPTAIGLPKPEPTGFHHPLADIFWRHVKEDTRVSEAFRALAEANLSAK